MSGERAGHGDGLMGGLGVTGVSACCGLVWAGGKQASGPVLQSAERHHTVELRQPDGADVRVAGDAEAVCGALAGGPGDLGLRVTVVNTR